MPSLALRVEVKPAAAEALSDALLEAGAQSVSIESPDAAPAVLEALFAETDDPARSLAASLAACGMREAPFTVRRIEDDDWVRRSQAQFAPLRIGRLWIGATWHEPPADAFAVVRVDPGLAFGTGSHPSTRLVLAFVERVVRGGERVLDYGCGSGILAIAAAKLGAAQVDAVDIDTQAVAVTRDNARANEVELRACLPEALAASRYDLVVANILAQPLIDLAPVLAERTAPGGQLALAGLLEPQATEVAAAYAASFAMTMAAREDNWALLCGVRR